MLAVVGLLSIGLLLPVAPPTSTKARVVFVVSNDRSPFGATSPQPSPTWSEVASHLADRLPGFDDRISAVVVSEEELEQSKIDSELNYEHYKVHEPLPEDGLPLKWHEAAPCMGKRVATCHITAPSDRELKLIWSGTQQFSTISSACK